MRAGVALLWIGAGAALVWLIKGLGKPRRHDRKLTLRATETGCRFTETSVDPVKLSRGRKDQLQWLIRNPPDTGCPGSPSVCMGRWTFNGQPADPPVVRVSGSDPANLCEEVPQPRTGVILVRAKKDAQRGKYKYSVLVNGVEVIDPMIQIVD